MQMNKAIMIYNNTINLDFFIIMFKINSKGSILMKKQLLYSLVGLILLTQACQYAEAKTGGLSTPMRTAIKKYKAGNYTGCLQDCQKILKVNPSNATAYYYLAISLVQAGKKDEAILAYSRVLTLNTNSKLTEYATTGKRCLETPDQCRLESEDVAGSNPEIDRLIATPSSTMSESVKKDFEKRRLDAIKNKINAGKDLDSYEFNRTRDFSKQKSDAGASEKLANNTPSDEEIAKALKILNDAGINPYAAQDVMQASQNPSQNMPQTSEDAQLQMLLRGNRQNNNNNDIMNMLPHMLSQNKNGSGNYSPQVMQAIIMNSMMPDFTFNLNNDNKQ